MKYILLQPNIYPLKFHILVGKWKPKQALALNPEFEALEPPGEHSDGHSWDCSAHQVIWIRSDKTIQGRSSMIHEMEHAVLQAGEFLGFEPDNGSEFYCYLMQWLFIEIWQWLGH